MSSSTGSEALRIEDLRKEIMLAQLQTDLITAMKSGQTDRVGVLRLLIASFKNERIKLGHDLDEAESMKVLQREAKQRQDSIAAYEQGGRAELAASERAELAVIQTYLPQQLGDEELAQLVDAAIAQTGATSKAQMGQVIGAVMAQAAGRADGATISRLVAAKLNG